MKVLIGSPAFYPRIGGLEEVTALIAGELHAAGDEVVVACAEPHDGPEPYPFLVVREPGPARLLGLVRWADVYFQSNVSLKWLWPLALLRRPWVVSHHSWYRQPDGRLSLRDRLKRGLLRYAAASIAVSRAMAEDLEAGGGEVPVPGGATRVIENPYRDDLFRPLPGIPRERDLAFLGRLVSDKGCDLLLEALGRLRTTGLAPDLTVIGVGPEEPALRRQAAELGLGDRVEFAGRVTGEALVSLLHRHRYLVVPSRYNEPFGIVALEGLACGCRVIGSAGGGLADAVGPGGWTFPNRDVAALAGLLARALRDELPAPDSEAVRAHLARHTRRTVGQAYRTVIATATADRSPDAARPSDSP